MQRQALPRLDRTVSRLSASSPFRGSIRRAAKETHAQLTPTSQLAEHAKHRATWCPLLVPPTERREPSWDALSTLVAGTQTLRASCRAPDRAAVGRRLERPQAWNSLETGGVVDDRGSDGSIPFGLRRFIETSRPILLVNCQCRSRPGMRSRVTLRVRPRFQAIRRVQERSRRPIPIGRAAGPDRR